MGLGSEDPAHFRLLAEFRLKAAPSVEKADNPDEPSAALLLDGPHAKAEELPAADERRQPPPRFLGVHGIGPEMPVHLGLPENGVVRPEVVLAPLAQDQTFGFDPRRFADQAAYFLPRVRPPKRLLKRATWPPSWTRRVLAPVHAGWTFGSMSRCSVSPSLPQVERTWNLVPSVIS